MTRKDNYTVTPFIDYIKYRDPTDILNWPFGISYINAILRFMEQILLCRASTTANFLKACFYGVIDIHYGSRVYGNLLFFSYQLLYIQSVSYTHLTLPTSDLV